MSPRGTDKKHQAKKVIKKSKKYLTNGCKCAIISMYPRGNNKFKKGIGDNYGKENDKERNVQGDYG